MKPSPTKREWHALRERYTWHLHPPFKGEFDNTHWWKAKAVHPEPAAALYELTRRHPAVGELWQKVPDAKAYGPEINHPSWGIRNPRPTLPSGVPEALQSLSFIGMQSWPQLTERARDFWKHSVGSMRGVDCRHETDQCVSITEEALSQVILERIPIVRAATKSDTTERDLWELVDSDFENCKPLPSEIEFAIMAHCVRAHRKGHLIISLPSDLRAENAGKLVARIYSSYRKLHHHDGKKPGKPRARPKEWLATIAEFEQAEATKDKAKAALFDRYRSILDGIVFNIERDHSSSVRALVKRDLIRPALAGITKLQIMAYFYGDKSS